MAVAQRKPSAAPLKDLYDIGEVPPLGLAKSFRLSPAHTGELLLTFTEPVELTDTLAVALAEQVLESVITIV